MSYSYPGYQMAQDSGGSVTHANGPVKTGKTTVHFGRGFNAAVAANAKHHQHIDMDMEWMILGMEVELDVREGEARQAAA